MKTKFLMICGALSASLLAATAAESVTPSALAPAAAEAGSNISTELKALMDRTAEKVKSGARTKEALAEELGAFDAILAAHRGESPDALAQVAFMKAALYMQVIADFDRGADVLRHIKANYPTTALAGRIDDMLEQIDLQKRNEKLQRSLVPGEIFPDFHEKDISGESMSVSDLRGKVVLIDFWATWCPPCVAELPNVLAAYDKYRAKGFEILGISLDRTEGALRNFVRVQRMPWPQYFDGKVWDTKLSRRYGITSIPTTFLLDREGRIVARDLRGPALEKELAKLLGE